MPRTVATYLRLLNLCAIHKIDPLTPTGLMAVPTGLMAVNALATSDFEMLGFWSKVADVEFRRQAP